VEARTYQPPAEAEAWLEEMLAHTKSGNDNQNIEEMRNLATPLDEAEAA